MKNRDEAMFAEWKKARLMEGFLDGEEEKPASSEDAAPATEEETTTEGEPTTEEAPAKEETAPEDVDVSDENAEETKDDGLVFCCN